MCLNSSIDFSASFARPASDVARDFAREARAGADEAFGVAREDFLVDARLVVHAFEMGGGDELDEVLVAGLVLGQEEEMGGGFLGAVGLAVEAAARREIDFAADDGLDAGVAAFLVKFDGAEKIAVVAQGQRGHFEFRGARRQLGDAGQRRRGGCTRNGRGDGRRFPARARV